jgi:hypothetical protein
MSNRILVAIPCTLTPGLFASERMFAVRLANGEVYRGIAPRHFCWNKEGRLIAADEPTEGVDGFVAARIVDELDDDQLAVEVPDSKVLAVDKNQVRSRPTEIKPPIPCLPTEPRSNVPV